MNEGNKALSEFIFQSKYSRYNSKLGRKETWEESVDRIQDMHIKHLTQNYPNALLNSDFNNDFLEFIELYKEKKVLGSQRGLQFGGDPILRKNCRLFNCFHKDTKFVTNLGVKTFNDLEEGQEILVPTHLGNWKKAIVKKYGKQLLNKITIKRGTSLPYEILATANHTWIKSNGELTTNLKVGDTLLKTPKTFNFDFDSATPFEKLYWCYGMVYGDGTLVKDGDEYKYSMIRLCGHKRKYLYRFEECGFKSSSPLSIKGDFMVATGTYLKTAPDPEIDSPNLIQAFVAGYLDADGYRNPNTDGVSKFISIQSSEKSHIEFIRKCFPIAGVYIISETDLTGQITSKGIRNYTISFALTQGQGKTAPYFKVINIEPAFEDEVWCLEVEDDHSFMLSNGLSTGNCSFTYCDRLEVFKEIEWVLLCGAGAGVSVEKQHVNKLPKMLDKTSNEVITYKVEDSIEGWANAIQALINYYFVENSPYPKFDYSLIRPSGSLISGGFLAPGPDGLRNSINKIQEILDNVFKTTKQLSSLNCTDIISHCADSVLSGGVRRSAVIITFDPDDKEMFNCKTGNWFYENPQRARFNMSAVCERGETSFEIFSKIFEATKQYGEPGFYWRSDKGVGPNPCCEVGFKPTLNGHTGWQFCNLITINGALVNSEEDFYQYCKAAATIGTIQATYNKFPFLGEVTEQLIEEDPLIGVSIGGIMNTPDILLNPEVLKKGATIVKEQNEKIANILGINKSSRSTVLKPDGNSSVLLSMTPGCHGEHAAHYIRRVQVNKEEEAGKVYKKYNPKAVIDSVWSTNKTDWCIQFPITAKDDSVYKEELYGTKQLEIVKILFNNWIIPGMRDENSKVQNNVSNTVQVPDNDWEDVIDWVWENQYYIAGISFIPASSDTKFNQPPYTKVLFPQELLDKYGEGIIFASGLIVDCEKIFGDLWKACDTFNGLGEKLYASAKDVEDFINELNVADKEDFYNKPHSEWLQAKEQQYDNWINVLTELNYSEEFIDEIIDNDIEIPNSEIKKYLDKTSFKHVHNLFSKRDIMKRMKKYGDKYFNSNYQEMIDALKQVQLYHDWCDITYNYQPVDWTKVKWNNVNLNADEMAGAACSGGQCEITKL